jgi:hypothetical protein
MNRVSAAGRPFLWFLLFFLLALLPRLSPVLAGVVFADDFIHTPHGHLQSHRLLNYVELGFWQGVAGDHYLLGRLPKVVACVYSALLCLMLSTALTSFGVPRAAALTVAILAPLHPIWNTFILWNVTGVYLLSLFLLVAGYWLLSRERPVSGILLIAVAISGYQVHLGLLPALLVAERPARIWRRLLECGAATALYLLATALIQVERWGNRGFRHDVAGLGRQLKPMADNLATLTQPLISFYLGARASWQYWALPFLAIALIALVRTRRLFAPAAVIALPLLAAAVILPLNVSPTGPRVAAPIWLAALIAAAPLLDRKWVGIAFSAIALPVSIAEASNWTRAWQADTQTAAEVRRFWSDRGVDASQVTVVLTRTRTPSRSPPEWLGRPIVLQNYSPVTPWTYSNVVWFPQPFFRASGMPNVRWEDEVPHGTPPVSGRSAVAQWSHDVPARQTLVTRFVPRD